MQRGSHGPAVIIQHCAVFGERQRPVQWWMVGEVKPYAQYDCSVVVNFIETGTRRKGYFTITPDNTKYVTVRVDGRVVYDSRTDVPCDMAKWEASADRYLSGRVKG